MAKFREDPDGPIAVFGADHRVDQSSDGGFRIQTHDGRPVATFDNSYFVIVSHENGRLSIFPKSYLGTSYSGGMQKALALVNRRNAEFWSRKS